MGTHPISRKRRAIAERDTPLATKRPDPHAVFGSRCDRCDVEITTHGHPGSECPSCVEAAQKVWPGAQPIAGQVSGG